MFSCLVILDYAANLTQLRLYIPSFSVFANRRGQHPTNSERNVELYLEFLFHCIAVKREEWYTILLIMMTLAINTNTDNNNNNNNDNTNDNNNDNNNDNDNNNNNNNSYNNNNNNKLKTITNGYFTGERNVAPSFPV